MLIGALEAKGACPIYVTLDRSGVWSLYVYPYTMHISRAAGVAKVP